LSLLNRKTELHIFAPKGIKEIIDLQLKLSKSALSYPLHYHDLISKKSELIYENSKVLVYTIPLKHRIYTNGFLFEEKPKDRKLNMKVISKFKEIEICDYQNLKYGKDFVTSNGKIIPNKELTFPPSPALKYAFCSDTSYFEDIIPIIKNADLLYHESTFLEDNEKLAKKTKHSTASEAAIIAKKAAVKKLILGHYSSRYKDVNLFSLEAKTIFEDVELSETGKLFLINN
jgi:ribonuclease Z